MSGRVKSTATDKDRGTETKRQKEGSPVRAGVGCEEAIHQRVGSECQAAAPSAGQARGLTVCPKDLL